MASLQYLWKNRAVFPIGSKQFFISWAKRIISLPNLLARNRRRLILKRKGANIDETSEIEASIITGNKKLLTIGEFSFLGRVNIALHEQLIIGNKVCINDGVEILTASHDVQDPEWKHIRKVIRIDDYAWIGTRAIILPGVHIGRGAVIGAGAVVSKSVQAGEIVVGNPANVISKKRCSEFVYNPCEFLAPNRAWLIG